VLEVQELPKVLTVEGAPLALLLLLNSHVRAARILTIIIGALATLAAAGGLLISELYRDNIWITSAWHGTDLVTLLVAVPLLLGASLLAAHGSRRAQLVWLAMLAYMVYGYAYYLFGAAFNRFFLLYVAIFALAILALLFAVADLDIDEIGRHFRERTPVRLIAGYMLLIALGLGVAWTAACLGFVVTGRVPAVIVASGHPTGIVFALDLSLLVPGFGLGGVWLWRRQPRGLLLAAIMTIKGATYTLALLAASVVATRAGVAGAAAEISLWLALTAAGLVACALLLSNVQGARVCGPPVLSPPSKVKTPHVAAPP
jgi:hypothetical protein